MGDVVALPVEEAQVRWEAFHNEEEGLLGIIQAWDEVVDRIVVRTQGEVHHHPLLPILVALLHRSIDRLSQPQMGVDFFFAILRCLFLQDILVIPQ